MKTKKNYEIGDVVLLNSMWDNAYGIVMNVSFSDLHDPYPPVYKVAIQGKEEGWLTEDAIVRKIE